MKTEIKHERISNFIIDNVKTVRAIQSKCNVCGFDNPKENMLDTCPICNTNLVAKETNILENEAFCIGFMFNK